MKLNKNILLYFKRPILLVSNIINQTDGLFST